MVSIWCFSGVAPLRSTKSIPERSVAFSKDIGSGATPEASTANTAASTRRIRIINPQPPLPPSYESGAANPGCSRLLAGQGRTRILPRGLKEPPERRLRARLPAPQQALAALLDLRPLLS